MKVVIRLCKSWGDISTFSIELNESAGPAEFMEKIRDKLKLKTNSFILRFSRDGFMVFIPFPNLNP